MTHADTRSLEDRLAQHLYDRDPEGKGAADIRPWQSVGYMTQARYATLAKEVIRLIGWNVFEVGRLLDEGRSNPIVGPALTKIPLTLPPNDWTP